ncbi:cyclic nucleotide-binding protein [Plasticicumulans lactativorans]|uniref:Cyclic nucleotide-binding protein n=1 Tax=Plasticicumulans lactativorans TaxID=1133106 RepID=A0A4R2KXC7_9GAMM|nr:cyclic nucleotide-binding domain-containing protein [Plasticicumulans lactativorans]TCO77537.1 cyclic nucleotide-binding protein [Plasticicumulans lactativorans]
MLLKDEVELLRRIPLFAHIEPSRLKLLAFTSERLVFEADEVICRRGDPGDAAYVVLMGSADVLVEQPDGSQVKIATLERDAVVGEIAVLADVPRTATVRAATRFEVLRIAKNDFLQLIRDFPEVAIEVLRTLARRLSWALGELAEARGGSAPPDGRSPPALP